MRTITRQLRRAIALVAILTTILAAIPLAGAAQDTADDQKGLCKHGGWQTLTRADGSSFMNQGECVKYVASEGGTFEDGSAEETETGLQLHVSSSIVYDGTACQYLVFMTGLTPESGRFDLVMTFGDLPPSLLPMASGWNGFGVNTVHDVNQVPATFTVYPYGASGMSDPIDTVTITSCGDSN